MKRLFLPAGCILVFLLTACGGNAKEANNPNGIVDGGNQLLAQTGEAPAGETGVKSIYGEISEVVGNSVTIKLMERVDNMNADGQFMQRGEMPASGSVTLPDGTEMAWDEDNPPDFSQFSQAEAQTGGGMRYSSGEASGGATGNEMIMRTGDGTGDTTGGMTRTANIGVARQYTGEEIEFIIPVGVPIMTISRTEDGVEETELELNKLKAESIITVTYKEDGTTIDKILVTTQTRGGGMPGGKMDLENLPANAQVTDFGDGRVMVTIPGPN